VLRAERRISICWYAFAGGERTTSHWRFFAPTPLTALPRRSERQTRSSPPTWIPRFRGAQAGIGRSYEKANVQAALDMLAVSVACHVRPDQAL